MIIRLLLLGFICCLPLQAKNIIATEDKPVDQFALRQFTSKTNQLGFDLYQRFRSGTGNIFFSPYSISSALAMTATGAQGETLEQMTRVLGIDNDIARFTGLHQGLMGSLLDKPQGYEIRIANALWGQQGYPFKEDFLQRVQRSFRAEGRTLDFENMPEESRQTINKWVEAQTRDRIKDLLPPGSIKPITRMVLTNAIYFNGAWAHPFDKGATKPLEFTLANADKIKTSMMYQNRSFQYAETEDLQLIEKPYRGRLSMVVVLPKQVSGLASVEEKLSAAGVNALLTKSTKTMVQVTLPKFKMTYTANLNDDLKALGIVDAFIDKKANFSGMDGTRRLYISDVVHKAYCDVHEEGTEAAAATGVVMELTSAPYSPPKPIIFKADHPFLFLIRDTQTGSILFMGRVMDPRN